MADPKQLSNLRVSALNVNSTRAALMVHTVNSSGEFVSPGAGSTVVSVKGIFSADGSTSLVDSTNNSLGVTIRAGSAAGTEYTDGDVDATISGGAVLFDNSSNTLRPVTLTRGLPVNLVQSTAGVTVSTGSIRVHQSTQGDLRGTVYQSTFTDLNCRINAPSTANSSNYLPVRITDGSSYITPGNEYTAGSTYSSFAGPTLTFDNSSNNTYRAVGVSTPLPVQLRTSSGADLADTTNTAIRVNVVAGAAGGSTVVTVSALPLISSGVAAGNSSALTVRNVWSSTHTDQPVSLASTQTINMRSSAANALVTVYQSTAADLLATVTLASTGNTVTARLTTSSGGALEGSTAQPAGNVMALPVRHAFPTLNSTTVLITSTNSTAIYALVSSAAGLRHKVFAYSVGSTHTTPSTLIFCSSAADSGFDHWHVPFGSGSSGMTGANLALTPPAWIFQSIAANALNVRIEGGGSTAASTVIARVSLAWFDEA